MKVDFHKIMRFVVIGVGIAYPIFFAYWRFHDTSEPNRFRQAMMSYVWITPLSVGLWLSLTKFGRKLKYILLPIIILSGSVHILFPVYPSICSLIVIMAELYAIYSIFKKVSV